MCTKKLWMDSGKIHIGFWVDTDFGYLRVWTSQLSHSSRTLSSSNVWRTISRPGHLTGIPFSIIILPCMCAFLHASRIWAGCTWTPLIICSVRFGFLASSFYLHQDIFSVNKALSLGSQASMFIIEPEPMTSPLETGVTLDQLNIPMVLKAPIAHGLTYFLCLWDIGV